MGVSWFNKLTGALPILLGSMTDKRFVTVQEGAGRGTIKHRKDRFALF